MVNSNKEECLRKREDQLLLLLRLMDLELDLDGEA